MNTSLGMKKIDLNVHKAIEHRNVLFALMLFGALIAFEIFNFSTTEFALNDALGSLTFMGIKWATILSIAFCGIDFAGVAKLFSPEENKDEPAEVWYLFGAWILAAGMNAMLTWWGVSIAISNHVSQGSSVIASTSLEKVIPVFVAIMVWLIRIMIIGTFSISGDKIFSSEKSVQVHQKAQSKNFGYADRANNTGFAPANRVKPHYKPNAQQSNTINYNNDDQFESYIN